MNIFNDIPESIIKKVAIEKINEQNVHFNDFCSIISRFRGDIVLELREINVLFSEYTPHDEDYHISNLFKIADILLGEETYSKMNAVELCLLIVALYAHDWGMAVSKSERYYIATRKKQEETTEFFLLEDEFERFEFFIKKKTGRSEYENDEEIDISYWQEYIRNTHALRSGRRVFEYFNKFNNGIARAIEKICIGHWLDIEEISEKNGYYRDTSVYGETVNLRALSIYVRLIDLFDLGEDRTPYLLWKFVNPQNTYSKMEWKKHRALHQITCPKYEKGRVICVSGSTDDHEVYAELMDLKKVCEKYFRECIDALAHMSDSRHELDIYLMDWRIETINFKPIEIEFNFDKENVFKMLSDEIYNCHPYVYVRELIQNSIDAINLRKKVLDRKGIGGGNVGLICLQVRETSDEYIEVVCQDDGIGMDEYILKNYFSMLGKSYYNSSDFKNMGIDMPVISKFGVGILSCFAVACSMEIITRREPYIEEGRQGLKVIINDMKKTFRVEEISDNRCEVGTKICLKINKKKLEEQLKKNDLVYEEYSVINYVKHVIKYIKYPIVIEQFEEKIILLPPKYNKNKLKNKVLNHREYDIYELNNEFPKKQKVLEQDLGKFEHFFQIREIDISKQLKIPEIEGKMCFMTLKSKKTRIKAMWGDSMGRGILLNDDIFVRYYPHTAKKEIVFFDTQFVDICNNGILIEGCDEQREYFRYMVGFFLEPYISVNFPNTTNDISLSRFEWKNKNELVDRLWKELHKFLSKEIIKEKNNLCEYEFWRHITIYVLEYRLDVQEFGLELFHNVQYPFINEKGKLVYSTLENMEKIKMLPSACTEIINEFNSSGCVSELCKWRYGDCLVANQGMYYNYFNINDISNSIIYNSIKSRFYLKEITFVDIENNDYPSPQEIWENGVKEDYNIKKIMAILAEYDLCDDIQLIKDIYSRHFELYKLVDFADEYSKYVSYRFEILNLNNTKIQFLLKYIWCFECLFIQKNIDKVIISEQKDKLIEVPFLRKSYAYHKKEYSFIKINEVLKDMHSWLYNFFPQLGEESPTFNKSDFIKGTIVMVDDDTFYEKREKIYELQF